MNYVKWATIPIRFVGVLFVSIVPLGVISVIGCVCFPDKQSFEEIAALYKSAWKWVVNP